MNSNPIVLYTAGDIGIHACVITDADGIQRLQYSRETVADFMTANPDAKLMTLDDAVDLIQAEQIKRFCTGIKEITAERFWEMLEVLPPAKWRNDGNMEIFHNPEHIVADLVDWFIRVNDRYFTVCLNSTTDRQLILSMAAAA